MPMKSLLGCMLVVLLGAATLPAQTVEESRGQGYLFIAPGAITDVHASRGSIHFGAGAEFALWNNFGVGAELGRLSAWRAFGDGIGVGSFDVNYQPRRSSRFSPFATTGYTVAIRNGHVNYFNYGIGAHYWYSKHQAIRLEFRDHLNSDGHIVEFRLGWAFH